VGPGISGVWDEPIDRPPLDGAAGQTTVASGTRNPTALAFHPQTGELWAVVQERDGLGDNLPSDYLIRVQQGGFYGWPYAYIGKHPQPGHRLPPCRQRGNRCG
jgi:glucose/arabinose dehydrogenase